MIAKSSPVARTGEPEPQSVFLKPGKSWGCAGRARNEAARRGDIPCLRIGTKALRVPTAALQRLLDSADKPASEGVQS